MRDPAALTVLVSGLIWPPAALADLAGGVPTPGLDRLLGQGRVTRGPGTGRWSSLLAAFGQPANVAPAPLRRLGLDCPPVEGRWLCLDPVHLGFAERRLTLGDPARLQLDDAEAAAFAVSLAPTFSGLGELSVDAPGAWHLRLCDGVPGVASPPVGELVGQRADAILGALDATWRKVLTEAQMQLHDHPVNRAREAAGKPVVNSLWPWGGGAAPAAGTCPHDAMLGDAPLAIGLARHAGIAAETLPGDFDAGGLTGHHPLVLLDALDVPARTGDAQAWRAALAELDARWFAPLAAAGTRRLTLRFSGTDGTATLERGGIDRLAFWRRPRPLTVLAAP